MILHVSLQKAEPIETRCPTVLLLDCGAFFILSGAVRISHFGQYEHHEAMREYK